MLPTVFAAFRYLRQAISDYYFDFPRMVILNLFWFATMLLFFLIASAFVEQVRAGGPMLGLVALSLAGALALATGGPGTAAAYDVTHHLAQGELMEVRRFWPAFARYFWRGWLLALADYASGGLLLLNIWFYWTSPRPGLWLLSVVFAYALLIWLTIQTYLFSTLVTMDQSVKLVIRNAFFMALDNAPLTVGLLVVNGLLLAISIPLGALLLPLATIGVLSLICNHVVIDLVAKYRAAGRVLDERKE